MSNNEEAKRAAEERLRKQKQEELKRYEQERKRQQEEVERIKSGTGSGDRPKR